MPATLSRPNSLRIIQSESLKSNNYRKDEVVSKHVGSTDLKSKNLGSSSAVHSTVPLKISQAQRLKELTETNNQSERSNHIPTHSTLSRTLPRNMTMNITTHIYICISISITIIITICTYRYNYKCYTSRCNCAFTSFTITTFFYLFCTTAASSQGPRTINFSDSHVGHGSRNESGHTVSDRREGSRSIPYHTTQTSNARVGGGLLRRELEHMMDLSAKNVIVALRCYSRGNSSEPGTEPGPEPGEEL